MPNEDKAVTEAKQATIHVFRVEKGGWKFQRADAPLIGTAGWWASLATDCEVHFHPSRESAVHAASKLDLADALQDAAHGLEEELLRIGSIMTTHRRKIFQRVLAAYDAAGKGGTL